MIKVEQEIDGKKYMVLLPPDGNNPDLGIPLGPPAFTEELDIPEPFATRLHNQMFNRELFTLDDIRRRPKEVQAALQSAMKVDTAKIIDAYAKAEKETLPFD